MEEAIPDRNDVEIFVRVVEQASFTSAAARLGLPKSTVSRRVSRLEQRLGVRLLQRTTRSLTLTAAGRIYFERVSRLLQQLDEVDADVAGLAQHPRGPLRITAPVTILAILPGLFSGFAASYPDVRLEVDIEDRFVDMIGEGFDLALRGGKPPDPSLAGHKVLNSDPQLLASPTYLERRGRPHTPADLAGHDCLVHGLRNPATWRFDSSRGQVEVQVTARLASNNVLLLLEAARDGLGIARLPTGGGRYSLSGLEPVLSDWTLPGGGLWLVYPSTRLQSPAARAFAEFVENRMRL